MRRGADTEVEVPPDLPGMTVDKCQGRKLSLGRKMYVLLGLSSPSDIRVHNNSLVNLVRALAERVMYSVDENGAYVRKIVPRRGVIRRRLGNFRSLVVHYCHVPPRRNLMETLELYRGRKRADMERAVASLMIEPITQRDARTKPFVKGNEKREMLGATLSDTPDPLPRVIQCRNPRYVISCAQWLKELEKPVFSAIARAWGEVTVAKGLNADQTGRLVHRKYNSFSDCAMVGLDASKFDKHVSVEMLQWEHSVYTALHRHDPELAQLLSWQLSNRGTGNTPEGKVRYSVKGCRMSGDINTSLGNCLIMCALVHAYSEFCGVHTKLINNGDDCVVFMNRRDVPRFGRGLETWFREMGFLMQVEEPVYEIEKMVFCQTQPVWVNGNYRMVRNPRVAAAKDCRTVVDISRESAARKWAAAVGDCGASLTDGIPISREYYSCMQRFGGRDKGSIEQHPAMESGMQFMARGMVDRGTAISAQTRYSFWLAFGVLPDQQRCIENYYRNTHLEYSAPALVDGSTKSSYSGAPPLLYYF